MRYLDRVFVRSCRPGTLHPCFIPHVPLAAVSSKILTKCASLFLSHTLTHTHTLSLSHSLTENSALQRENSLVKLNLSREREPCNRQIRQKNRATITTFFYQPAKTLLLSFLFPKRREKSWIVVLTVLSDSHVTSSLFWVFTINGDNRWNDTNPKNLSSIQHSTTWSAQNNSLSDLEFNSFLK